MLDLLVVCVAVGGGLLGGWWLRGAQVRPRMPEPETPRAPTMTAEQIRAVARNVASDVDHHRLLMEQVTEQLRSLPRSEPASVLTAMEQLIRSNEQIQQQLESAERKLQQQAQELETHATAAVTDPLTQLANRRALDETMAQAVEAAAAGGQPATLLLLDIDRFKQLNDNYGHQAGDDVLRTVAGVLRGAVGGDDLVARHGGEEFAVVFPNQTLDAVVELAERIRQAVGKTATRFEGLELVVTLSAGLAQLAAGEAAGVLMRRADEALYVSKETGRDRGSVHDGRQVVPCALWSSAARRAPTPDPVELPSRAPAGLADEAAFCDDLRRRMTDWRDGGAPLCLVFLQLDDLDLVRRKWGEKNAQAMLRATTLLLKATMRELDHVGQFQGNAYSLLLPGSDLAGAVRAAERIRLAVARCELPAQFAQRTFTATAVVAKATANENEQQLVERVRQSLASVHAHGHNSTYVNDGTRCFLVGAGQVAVPLAADLVGSPVHSG